MAPVKLQINSLAALERLIGGDSDLELEMRNSIVQEFSKKYLKGVADRICGTIESVAHQECVNVAQKHLGNLSNSGYGYSFRLSEDARAAIVNQVDLAITNLVIKLVKDQVDKKDIEKFVQREVDRRIDAQVKELVNQEVKEKLAEVVKNLRI